jgi:hypothetical protein
LYASTLLPLAIVGDRTPANLAPLQLAIHYLKHWVPFASNRFPIKIRAKAEMQTATNELKQT